MIPHHALPAHRDDALGRTGSGTLVRDPHQGSVRGLGSLPFASGGALRAWIDFALGIRMLQRAFSHRRKGDPHGVGETSRV